MRKGTPNQFISELEDKINQLKGVESAEIVDDGVDYIEAGCQDDEVDAGCHGDEDKKRVEAQESAVDENDETSEADTVNIIDNTSVEEIADEISDPDGSDEDDYEDYLNDLYGRVEDELADLLEGVSWGSDAENIFMDVSFSDGHVITFTIPREDLTYDLANPDVDVKYICTAVRDSQDETDYYEEEYPEEEAGESMEDLLDDYDIPAYL